MPGNHHKFNKTESKTDASTMTEHSISNCHINCACVLPITLRMPISFKRLFARATVVFEKLRQAERKIRTCQCQIRHK